MERLWRVYSHASDRITHERRRWESWCRQKMRKAQRQAEGPARHDRAVRQIARYVRLCRLVIEERRRIANEKAA
jgi:hypothetical protein